MAGPASHQRRVGRQASRNARRRQAGIRAAAEGVAGDGGGLGIGGAGGPKPMDFITNLVPDLLGALAQLGLEKKKVVAPDILVVHFFFRECKFFFSRTLVVHLYLSCLLHSAA
jgi:hypothetical protein